MAQHGGELAWRRPLDEIEPAPARPRPATPPGATPVRQRIHSNTVRSQDDRTFARIRWLVRSRMHRGEDADTRFRGDNRAGLLVALVAVFLCLGELARRAEMKRLAPATVPFRWPHHLVSTGRLLLAVVFVSTEAGSRILAWGN
jgi:hypothetical protein